MKLEIGQIVKYSDGPTALARVFQVNESGSGYGDQCLGGIVFLNEKRCSIATEKEIEEAKKSQFWSLS